MIVEHNPFGPGLHRGQEFGLEREAHIQRPPHHQRDLSLDGGWIVGCEVSRSAIDHRVG